MNVYRRHIYFVMLACPLYSAWALTAPVTVTGRASRDLLGDPDNVTMSVDLNVPLGLESGEELLLTGVGWNVTLTTVGASWLSEIHLKIANSDDVVLGYDVSPGSGDERSGSEHYSSGGPNNLSAFGVNNLILPDGVVRLEFYETYDDFENDNDAIWEEGTLVFEVIPQPRITEMGLNPENDRMVLHVLNTAPNETHRVQHAGVPNPATWFTTGHFEASLTQETFQVSLPPGGHVCYRVLVLDP